MKDVEVLAWYEQVAGPFLEKFAPDRLQSIKADYDRLKRLSRKSDEVTVCFLGNSGVGKSTLLNALAAGDKQVLPAGGIGPLTAQATEVRFSDERRFRVTYHPKSHLWRLAFAMEARLMAANRSTKRQPLGEQAVAAPGNEDSERQLSELAEGIDEQDEAEALERAQLVPPSSEVDAPASDALEGFIKQAKNIVCGNQFADRPLEYLVDALRQACGYKIRWNSAIDAADLVRIRRVHQILKDVKADRSYERRESNDPRGFQEDMTAHAAGFLSPLIERIEVGWPSEILRSGVVLVDLPGVGIAQDSYREVTKNYVGDKARAVIVTVDRAGPTEATLDLLRTSGYWERLVGASDDPSSDACSMLIAVTRVDDVAQTEWQNLTAALQPGAPKPKRRDVFARLVDEFKPRMKAQIVEQLDKIGDSSNESVKTAREQARASILKGLEIHPVSAPELRKLLLDDEDDRPFLSDAEQTGVPELQRSLVALAQSEREARDSSIKDVSARLASALLSEVRLIEGSWQQENRAAEEADRLAASLAPILDEKKGEYRARAALFRGFLDETVQAKIEALVLEARAVAEEEVAAYLNSLRGAHWATLRAAVRRGGAFYGTRHVDLPNDITGYFQEPMAAVWGQKLLRDIRRKTTELANDTVQMVHELCEWAHENGGATVNKQLLKAQEERVAALADQMKSVGKEAVDELRETVKNELSTVIRKPIKAACEKFVQDGDDIGPGVKWRILDLFNRLAKTATEAARQPAVRILQENAASVRADIQAALKKGGNPLQDTADLVVESHEARVRRSDAQKRGAVLAAIRGVLDACPCGAPSSPAASS